LFEIDESEKASLDHFEGAGGGYNRIDKFAVYDERNTIIESTTYLAAEQEKNLKPFDWYLALIVAGARQHQLPEAQISSFRLASYLIDRDNKRQSRMEAISAMHKAGILNYSNILERKETDLIQDIIMELTRIQGLPIEDVDRSENSSLPSLISAGEAGSLIVTRKIDDSISSLAKIFMNQNPAIKRSFTQSEWRSLVRKYLGPILASIDLDDHLSDNVEKIL
jgi:hypothetical protein